MTAILLVLQIPTRINTRKETQVRYVSPTVENSLLQYYSFNCVPITQCVSQSAPVNFALLRVQSVTCLNRLAIYQVLDFSPPQFLVSLE